MASASGGLLHAYIHEFAVVPFASDDPFRWSLVHRSTFERPTTSGDSWLNEKTQVSAC